MPNYDANVLYDRAAVAASKQVIATYSTSFGAATRLLGQRVRPHVRNIYALVRVADEIVDGPGRTANATEAELRACLDDLEEQTARAIASGFSTNLVVHAFALTARECGISSGLIRPFFDSMRTDIAVKDHDAASHETYVYGSAEVVGLMCLQAFVNAAAPSPVTPPAHLVAGARQLGAAFQNVNFLRDQAEDQARLGRDYLVGELADRTSAIDHIRADLRAASRAIVDLPADCKVAVSVAHDLFAELCDRLEKRSTERVSVPTPKKLEIIAKARARRGPRKSAV